LLEPADHLGELFCARAIGRDVHQYAGQLGDDLVDRTLTVGIRAKHLSLIDGRFQILLHELVDLPAEEVMPAPLPGAPR
jgi:hypothetical protein